MFINSCRVNRLFFSGLLLMLLNLPLAAAGVLDPSFGSGGRANVAGVGPLFLLVQPDNKIIIAGPNGNDGVAVARLNENGTLDAGFGVRNIFPGFARDLKLQPDGKILVSGTLRVLPKPSTDYHAIITRLNADGSFDTSFGNASGSYRANRYNSGDSVSSIALLPDGKILGIYIGSANSAPQSHELFRLNANGLPDDAFGNQGFLPTDSTLRGGDILEPAGNNKFLVGFWGRPNNTPADIFRVRRVNADGTTDTSFGQNGLIQYEGELNELIVQPDGKFITTGRYVTRRFTGEGAIDESFRIARTSSAIALFPNGSGRFVTIDSAGIFLQLQNSGNDLIGLANGSPGRFSDVAVLNDGKILALNGGSVIRYKSITSLANQLPNLDADEKTDIGVYRPSTGTFYFLKSQDGLQFYWNNTPVGTILPENFGGDFRSDLVWWMPSSPNSCYYGFYSGSEFGYRPCFAWGLPADVPVGGDYDGDNKSDFAIFRDGHWHIRKSATGESLYYNWGMAGDKPVPADYDYDGITDPAIYRPSNGTWWILRSSDFSYSAVQFGIAEDKPVPADYDGDGRADVAVYRPSNGFWYLLQSANGFSAVQFGISSDRPVPGDYDGDGLTDIAVWRSGDGYWYLLRSAAGFGAAQWGQSGDIPLTTAYSAF
jgi:uncharacterized delta-60 repeat protein